MQLLAEGMERRKEKAEKEARNVTGRAAARAQAAARDAM
jgi:hypothetical protein